LIKVQNWVSFEVKSLCGGTLHSISACAIWTFVCTRLSNPVEKDEKQNGSDETSYGVYKIVGLDVDGGTAEKYIKWKHDNRELVADAPGKNEQNGACTNVGTGKGGCWALSFVGQSNELVEKTVWNMQRRCYARMGEKIVVNVWENTMEYVV
jgi:hypothetical protein